jgi:restriction modification system DNA specificity domain protein
MTLSNHIAIGLMLEVKLGKMLQTEKNAQNDLLRPYLRAAHIQPSGQLDLNVDMKEMWFSDREVRELDLRPGDGVIVEGGAGFGRAAYLENGLDGWGFQNSIIRLRGLPANVRYAVYALGAALEVGEIALACNAATFAHFTAEKVQRFRIPFHGAEEHARIVDYLDRETAEIDAMLAALDELTRNLKQRSGIVVANELKSHYLHGTIPLAFSSGADNFFDGDWVESKDQDPDGDIRLLQLADIGDGTFLDKSNRRINQEAFERLRCREVQAGDILIARMPHPLGRACILPTGLGRTITVVDVAVLRPDPNRIIPKYLVYVLNSISFRAQLDSLQSGSTRQRISRSRLGQQRIPMPPVALQRAAVSHLDEVTGRIDAMLAKIDELRALLVERRAALITDVVTGRKKVPA